MITVTVTEIQNNFGKYLKAVQNGNEIIILENGIEIARLVSKENTVSFLTSALPSITVTPVYTSWVRPCSI